LVAAELVRLQTEHQTQPTVITQFFRQLLQQVVALEADNHF
jgi:hypothetical protein